MVKHELLETKSSEVQMRALRISQTPAGHLPLVPQKPVDQKSIILTAAKATGIPIGSAGQWAIRRIVTDVPKPCERDGKSGILPPGTYTFLMRWTLKAMESRLSGDEKETGECVMEDTLIELNRHMQFMLAAHGNVLITGLGLGCVVRGCLANHHVDHVTVIERCPDILKLVAPHMDTGPRLTIVPGDAVEWCEGFARNTETKFDCAWHDVWSDPDQNEPELQRTHLRLLMAMRELVPLQGAWNFPRMFRRVMRPKGVL